MKDHNVGNKMTTLRLLPLSSLIILLLAIIMVGVDCSSGAPPSSMIGLDVNDKNVTFPIINSNTDDSDAQSTFSKRAGSGQQQEMNDQLAIESVEHREIVHHQMRRPVHHHHAGHSHGNHQIPVPVPMATIPGTMIFPVPPQQHQGTPFRSLQLGGGGRQTNNNKQPDFRITKGKEIYASPIPIGIPTRDIHSAHHNQHTSIHHGNHLNQQINQIHHQKSVGHSEGKIMTKPIIEQNQKININKLPQSPQPTADSDAHLANTLFQNLFEKQRLKNEKNHNQQNSGGPPKQIVDLHEAGSAPLTSSAASHHPLAQYGGVLGPNPLGPWSQQDGDMPKITSLEVKCEKNVMRVYISFDRPFTGVIFSKGHYHNINCIHLPAGLGHTSANFDISIDSCGTQGNTENGLYGHGVQAGSGSYFENIIVIQYDSQVQEVWDQARKLRCTWHDQYEKSVTFRPFPVDMLDVVRADFAGDNVGCWMQIQVGKGPWASEVSGLVKIGQTMTMVLAIKDDDNKFDMLVRNCMAHDGVRAPIQLVDQFGCVTRPKLMSRFTKIKNFGQSASVLSYAHFQAFKFPDSMEVHFQCTIQICRFECPEQCVKDGGNGGDGRLEHHHHRKRRSLDDNSTIGVEKSISVVTTEDIEYATQGVSEIQIVNSQEYIGDVVCMSTFGFVSMLIVLIGTLFIAVVMAAVVILRRRTRMIK